MKNTTILEMLNNGQVEELKKILSEEIYADSLKCNTNAKKRYEAMKRYFKYGVQNANVPALTMPCKDVEVFGDTYNSFCDGYSFALTTENIGKLDSFDKSKGDYFNIEKFINFTNAEIETIDIHAIIAEAKSKGYKFRKSEFSTNDFEYLFKYKDSYYKFGILDKAYSIIDDGNKVECHYKNRLAPLLIKSSIGMCAVCPMHIEKCAGNKIIIEA